MSLKDELIDEGFNIGVNGLHPSVLAHVRHVAGKDVETEGKRRGATPYATSDIPT